MPGMYIMYICRQHSWLDNFLPPFLLPLSRLQPTPPHTWTDALLCKQTKSSFIKMCQRRGHEFQFHAKFFPEDAAKEAWGKHWVNRLAWGMCTMHVSSMNQVWARAWHDMTSYQGTHAIAGYKRKHMTYVQLFWGFNHIVVVKKNWSTLQGCSYLFTHTPHTHTLTPTPTHTHTHTHTHPHTHTHTHTHTRIEYADVTSYVVQSCRDCNGVIRQWHS